MVIPGSAVKIDGTPKLLAGRVHNPRFKTRYGVRTRCTDASECGPRVAVDRLTRTRL